MLDAFAVYVPVLQIRSSARFAAPRLIVPDVRP